MKETKRALRRHHERRVYMNRLRREANTSVMFIEKDKTYARRPAVDFLKSNRYYQYKSAATICSCSMCKLGKYVRTNQKRIDEAELRSQLC